MDKFFNSDNVVMRTLSKIFDIGWLTLIYLVFCIPIVTVGAATTSLYYVSAKVLRHNRSYVWREFWHSFKTNFLQSTIAWVVTAIIVVLLWLNMNIVAETGGEKGGYLIGAYYALLFIILCISCYIYPIISRFGTKFSQILRLSLYCAFRHFLHTLLMLVILAATVTLACLKTSVGLITSCVETFCGMFPKGPGYRAWAVLFTLISFALSNFGLSTIISYSVPVLMFLYPLAIALVLLALFGRFYRHDRAVYISVIVCTLLAALYDLICALPEGLYDALHADAVQAFGLRVLPFAGAGLGWICPLALGFVIGLAVHLMQKFRTK